MYRESVEKPYDFWYKVANENYHWKEKNFSLEEPKSILDYNFDLSKGPIHIEWFKNSLTNICYNALDRHVENGNGDRVAFYYEGNDINDNHSTITYKELLKQVCKFGNVLRKLGVKKGDRVAMYMPMVMELIIAVLACARIGAIHSVVFGGFSAEALASRLIDSHSKIIVTSDYGIRGDKLIALKQAVDEAIDHHCQDTGFTCEKVIVVNRMNSKIVSMDTKPSHSISSPQIHWYEKRDVFYNDLMNDETISEECQVEWVKGEDGLFMLYTSGSTGKPKGLLHTTAGYMIYTSTTFKYVFDYHENDVYWCGADIGWITGHSYVIYGPLICGATSVIFEGIPTYPTPSRYWQIIDKYKVNQFYTAPTLIRTLMKIGDEHVKNGSTRDSLRILGSVGEPINPEAWLWYHNVIGNGKCAIVDTFWQTESGGHLITPIPGCITTKPGSATFPFFGVQPAVLPPTIEPQTPAASEELEGDCEGYLAIKFPWPGIARTIFGDHDRYEKTYFGIVNGYYMTGDGCRRDSDGYIWLTGRVDDVLNVSGHRLGTAELESAFVAHSSVAEAAVVPCPHDIKGHGIYCYVVLKDHVDISEQKKRDELSHALKQWIRHEIGPVATPDFIHFAFKFEKDC
ncbi:acetyl-coenzyme A synthetase [Naegleria gruberi]|uniref:Acetyl-coenzyme A synthetase n=1 Tax=Naegleria gruberi TaxID=5762 RepID=D2V1W3_NAEGR|nr:acetyl-coenzyme A synthetase [Naegleria gruberi]EFC49232.1 acetyl-coenzyme A synthetase [Naegleria gruberi]|eukprot:XP_002681976.1 acetyl-coenzyme A synthetase [Naegleria gruberi strain NEG-M]